VTTEVFVLLCTAGLSGVVGSLGLWVGARLRRNDKLPRDLCVAPLGLAALLLLQAFALAVFAGVLAS
jgi:hypothetical protein